MNLVARVRRHGLGIALLVLLLAAAGVFEVRGLPSAIFPSVTFPVIKVIASSGEEPPTGVVPTLTRPIEEALLRVPGIIDVRSVTSRGSVELTGQFGWGTDMQAALQRVEAETQRIRPGLPTNTTIDVEWMNPATFPIQGYALTSDQKSEAELLEIAEYTLKPALVRIPGVSQVQIQGGRNREFRVELNQAALSGRHLSVHDVITAIKKSNQILSMGLIEQNHELYLSVVDGQVHDLNALGKISVPVANGVPAMLSELGKVTSADEVSYIRTTADGHPAVLLNIIRQPSANTVAIASGIDDLMKARTDLIPEGVRWSKFYDQAAFVSDSIRGTRDAILIGVMLAALVLLAFLKSWRLALIAVINIPLTVAIVGLGLAMTGNTINLMTLAGVAAGLGLIADDAIVVIENIHRFQERRAADPTEGGTMEILPALIGSSLSTIVILLPFSLLSGVVGAFFKPLALTLAVALIVSFALALFIVPLNVSLFGPRLDQPTSRIERAFSAAWKKLGGMRLSGLYKTGCGLFSQAYEHTVESFVHFGWLAAAALVALMVGTVLLYGRLPNDFLPPMDEGSIILDYWTPPGTSLTDTNQALDEAEKVIQSIPDVLGYSRRTGTQLGFFITEPNRGDYVIRLKPKGQRQPVDHVIEELRSRIAAVEPSIHTDFGQLLEDTIGDLSGGTPQPIDIKIIGDDVALLQQKAKEITQLVSLVPGTADVFNGIVIAGPTLRVEFNPVAGARYGVTAEDLHASLDAAITGTVVGKVRVSEKTYDLRVLTSTSAPLEAIRIQTPSGANLAVGDVAKVMTSQPETEIDRENLKSYIGVTARLSGSSLGTVMSQLRKKIADNVHLEKGVRLEYGGMYQQQQSSFQALLWILLAGLVLVSAVVIFEFSDWRAAVVTSLAALGDLCGVFLALKLTGQTLNISSYVGAIMMVGIVGENAIFVIHQARLELRRGMPAAKAWVEASRMRLRPVAMTVLATGLALAPLALAIGQGSQLMQPLAIAVIGGFVFSGPMVLLVVPGLYHLLDPSGRLARQ